MKTKTTKKTLLERKATTTPVADKPSMPRVEAVMEATRILQEAGLSAGAAGHLADVMLRNTEITGLDASELTKETS